MDQAEKYIDEAGELLEGCPGDAVLQALGAMPARKGK
jgi:hypothetical protein